MNPPLSRRRFLATSALGAPSIRAFADSQPPFRNWRQAADNAPRETVEIIRRSGYRGYVPIETLSMGRKGYDPYVEVTRMLTDLRAALAGTESVTPVPRIP